MRYDRDNRGWTRIYLPTYDKYTWTQITINEQGHFIDLCSVSKPTMDSHKLILKPTRKI